MELRCCCSWLQRALDVTHNSCGLFDGGRIGRRDQGKLNEISFVGSSSLTTMVGSNTVVPCNRLFASALKEQDTLEMLMVRHSFLSSSPALEKHRRILRSWRMCLPRRGICCDPLLLQHAWENTATISAVVSTKSWGSIFGNSVAKRPRVCLRVIEIGGS